MISTQMIIGLFTFFIVFTMTMNYNNSDKFDYAFREQFLSVRRKNNQFPICSQSLVQCFIFPDNKKVLNELRTKYVEGFDYTIKSKMSPTFDDNEYISIFENRKKPTNEYFLSIHCFLSMCLFNDSQQGLLIRQKAIDLIQEERL